MTIKMSILNIMSIFNDYVMSLTIKWVWNDYDNINDYNKMTIIILCDV